MQAIPGPCELAWLSVNVQFVTRTCAPLPDGYAAAAPGAVACEQAVFHVHVGVKADENTGSERRRVAYELAAADGHFREALDKDACACASAALVVAKDAIFDCGIALDDQDAASCCAGVMGEGAVPDDRRGVPTFYALDVVVRQDAILYCRAGVLAVDRAIVVGTRAGDGHADELRCGRLGGGGGGGGGVVEAEADMLVADGALAIDDACHRPVCRAQRDGLAVVVEVTVPLAAVKSVGEEYRVAVRCGVDAVLNRAKRSAHRTVVWTLATGSIHIPRRLAHGRSHHRQQAHSYRTTHRRPPSLES